MYLSANYEKPNNTKPYFIPGANSEGIMESQRNPRLRKHRCEGLLVYKIIPREG